MEVVLKYTFCCMSDLLVGKLPNIYVETASLTEGEIPKEAIPVTAAHPSPLQYWKEVARYVLYEEVYDDEAEVFDNAQCPTVPHHVLEKLLSILRDGKILVSEHKHGEFESIMDLLRFDCNFK